MNPAPQPSPGPAEPLTPAHYRADAASDAPPPHVLWATLESAYAPPERALVPHEERLAPYLALPMAVGLSLVLWIIIAELVLTR